MSAVKGSPFFPRVEGSQNVSTVQSLDRSLADLKQASGRWRQASLTELVATVEDIRSELIPIADQWIQETLRAKGIPPDSFGELEEWALLSAVFRILRVLSRSLKDIGEHGRPMLPGPISRQLDGQAMVPIFPQNLMDRIVYQGIRGEIHMLPGVGASEVIAQQAKSYRSEEQEGKVVLVLGAGNLALLIFGDILTKLFVERKVVVLKLNPVNDYIGPLLERALDSLIKSGYLRIVYGGGDIGAYLCNHPDVDEIHMTGSDKTYEEIVFGSGEDGVRRKAEGKTRLAKPITGELGTVSPVIVVPGEWDPKDLTLQSERIASWLGYNAGCNCITPRVIVQHKEWPQREAFLDSMRGALESLPTRAAYYPGARNRYEEFLAHHPSAETFGSAVESHLPWLFIPDLDPTHTDEICFQRESFTSQIAETALSANGTVDSLEAAVSFVNERLWGNLLVTFIVDPASMQDRRVRSALHSAVADVKYGVVCVNMYAGLGYAFGTCAAGAYPGNTNRDIQSGVGHTTNFLMLEGVEKSVYWAPFRSLREPLNFTTRKMSFGRRLAEFEMSPNLWNLSRLGIELLLS